MSLAQAFQDPLFLPFKTFCFIVFLSDLNNLLLDDLVFVLAHLGPLLRDDLLAAFFHPLLVRFDLPIFLFHLAKVPCFLPLASLGNFLAFFLDSEGLLLTENTELVS